MKQIFMILSLFFSSMLFAQFDINELDKIIEKVVKEKQPVDNTGVAISVFRSNKIMFSKGYGYKDQKNKLSVDIKTLFSIGSTTKAFTSVGIGQLVDKGKISFSDLVTRHLPKFKVKNQELRDQILIEDILSHRTGLPRHDIAWYFTEFTREENFNHIQYLDFNPNAGMGFRESFQYNNFMFLVAGTLIEEVSGMSWEQYTQNNILTPLKMNDTYLSAEIAQTTDNLAVPYYLNKKLKYVELADVASAGSIFSNVIDMSKWLQLHLRKGINKQGSSLISESSLKEIYTPRIPLINDEPDMDYSYGFGWMLDYRQPSKKLIFHGGNIDGFTALVLISHDLDLGIVVLVNQSNSRLNNDIVLAVLDYFSLPSEEDKNFVESDFLNKALNVVENKKFITSNNKIFNLDSIFIVNEFELSEYVGNYIHPGYGEIQIELINGELWARYYFNYWKLRVVDDEVYDFEVTVSASGYEWDVKLKFNLNINGEIVCLGIPFEPALGYDLEFVREEIRKVFEGYSF